MTANKKAIDMARLGIRSYLLLSALIVIVRALGLVETPWAICTFPLWGPFAFFYAVRLAFFALRLLLAIL